MHKLVRILSLVLVLAVLLVPMAALARYAYISSITAGLSISGGTAYCDGTFAVEGGYAASVKVVLRQSADGGKTWSNYASWSGSSSTGAIGAGGSKSLVSGFQYKVTTYGTCKDSSGNTLETASKDSATKTY